MVPDEKYCLSCEIYRNSFLCFVTLEQWFQEGDNPSDIRFLSLFNDLQSRSNGIGIRYKVGPQQQRYIVLQGDEGQAHCSKAEPCSGATYTNHTQSGTLLVTVDFHNEVLFKFISYPTLGVETKLNE